MFHWPFSRRSHLNDDPPDGSLSLLAHLSRCAACQHAAPPAADRVAQLRAQLAAASAHLARQQARRHRWLASAAMVAIAMAGVFAAQRLHRPTLQMAGGLLPNPMLTPGEATAVPLGQVCQTSVPLLAPDPTPRLTRQVFREYQMPVGSEGEFEVDYLVTPALGGTSNVRNLWPQPHQAIWSSYAKDQLETYLRSAVCRGDVPLKVAQNALAHNWIRAYRHFFHTHHPLSEVAMADPGGARLFH
jgi:hypothetical protein